MPLEYLKDGDEAFIGLNSRYNPASLPKGIVSKSKNFRLDRGVATVRKGIQRKTSSAIVNQSIYGTCVILNSLGQEIFVIAVNNGLYTYNPETEIFSTRFDFPEDEIIEDSDIVPPNSNGICDMAVAVDKIYISRGHSKRPLIASFSFSSGAITDIIVAPTTGDYSKFPNCNGLLYYGNRLIATGQSTSEGYSITARARDSVCVSNYLDFKSWDESDVFNLNEGSNDETIALAPWSLTEFVVFLRNSIYYLNVGTGRYTYSSPLDSTASLKMLVSDIGCNAKRSIVQANGGLIFLSNNGVYFFSPTQVGANDATRLLTNSKPLSEPIDDVIQRINKDAVYRSVATYWNNRYYLAVPLNSENPDDPPVTENNCVLVYNFILQSWESVDTYPSGFDVFSFIRGKKNNQNRLFGFDKEQGVFLFEELEYDEYGDNDAGTPRIGYFKLDEVPKAIISGEAFLPNSIEAELVTRLYTFNNLRDKRFSTAEVDMLANIGSGVNTYAETVNQDTSTLIDTFNSPSVEDFTRRTAIRKIAYGLNLKFIANYLRTSIRSVNVTATILGKQNISKK